MFMLLLAAFATNVEAAPVAALDPRVAAAREARADEIASLRHAAEDRTRGAEERVASLRDLAFISEDDALAVAVSMKGDPDLQVAVAAVDMLSASIVLMAHGGHAESATPWEKTIADRFEAASTALRLAASDPRPEVADQALASLARASDPAAISLLREGIRRGSLPETRAASLCAQATPEIGRGCLIQLLNEGSAAGRAAAISHLASRPTDQVFIRNKILLNSNAAPALRAVAAETLGRYDRAFSGYGMLLATDPATPPALFASLLRAYARREESVGALDSLERRQLLRSLENKISEVRRHTPSSGEREALRPLIQLQQELRADR